MPLFSSEDRPLEPGERLADVICPQCRQPFRLIWNDYTNILGKRAKETLHIRSCPSGGVYSVEIGCPHCNYVEEL
jgi:hypothetical protein